MKIVFTILAACLLLSCSKSSFEMQFTTAVVYDKGGATSNSYLVRILKEPGVRYSFLCNDGPGPIDSNANNCFNSIYITNLPSDLRSSGTVITFSKFKHSGVNLIWSSSLAPHDVEVFDAKRR